MELLATVDGLIYRDRVPVTLEGVKVGLSNWFDPNAARRKTKLFDDELVELALERLTSDGHAAPMRES